MKQKKLAIVTTHPIQYNAPLFRQMNEADVCYKIKVFYTWSQSKEKVFDKEFGVDVKWDLPLLDGYEYTFVHNASNKPGSHHFTGIINPSLNKEIVAWQADAVLIFGWAFASHLKALRFFHKKIPVLFRGDSTLLDELPGISAKKIIRRAFLRWIYRYVDYAMYVGTENKKYFLANGLKREQLFFAPHAVDNDRFTLSAEEAIISAKKWRKDLHFAEDEIVFLFAGKLSEKKNPELLIKAFLALQIKATLVLVGNGQLENDLKEKYNTHDKIIFINFQNQMTMPAVYRLADIFVLPSKGPGETWGLAINEAMACGRAVIVSDKCGCSSDLVTDAKNGFIFESENQQDLKSCMLKSVGNFRAFGLHSFEIIKNWNYGNTIEQLDNLLKTKLADEES